FVIRGLYRRPPRTSKPGAAIRRAMQATMQDRPLTITALFEHGARLYGDSEVVTAGERGVRRASFAEVAERAARLAGALRRLGILPGDRVATFGWNTPEHLEAYLAVPSMGAVLHTLNIRLFPEQLAYVAHHAEDRVVLVDASCVPLLAPVARELRTVEHFVVIGDGDAAPLGSKALRHAELLAAEAPHYDWPALDERAAAAMCYTSGTTGNPKGVVYSHRSAVPRSLMERFERQHRVRIVQAWGMTETSPLAAIALPPKGCCPEEELDWRAKAGRVVAGVELRVVDEAGRVLPWDGKSAGEIEVRGAWVTGAYHRESADEKFHDGWLRTGDVGTVDAKGFIQITDRAKDVIKSGGEWISSVELENALMAHPDLVEAAVIAVPDPRWDERPLACVVPRPGASVTVDALKAFLAGRGTPSAVSSGRHFSLSAPTRDAVSGRSTLGEEQPRSQPPENVRRAEGLGAELDRRRDRGLVGAGEIEIPAAGDQAHPRPGA